MDKIKEKIAERVNATIREYETRKEIKTKWGEALIGYADATDDLFALWMQELGLKHPKDIFRPGKTVIAFYIPFEKSVHESNKEDGMASEIWAVAYKETILLCALVNDAIIETLDEMGRITSLTTTPRDWDPETFHCTWSHRHAAYAAGLGTFGMHHGLITEKGCAGRFGSVITDFEIEPTPRPEKEFCLYKANGSCGLCMKICPAGALSPEGMDKKACYDMCMKNEEIHQNADVCGKCMSGKPCSF